MRKRCRRRVITPRPPAGLRERLGPEAIRALSMAHNVNHADLVGGRATPQVMWQWAGGCLTWSRAAQLVGIGQEEMDAQLALCDRVIQRFKATGRIELLCTDDLDERELSRIGVICTDQLAELIDVDRAIEAVEWSMRQIHALYPTAPQDCTL
jgi:hypothetical protein